MSKLFLVVLGGRVKNCHVEQHDVRWVIGQRIEETIPTLKNEWIGLRSGLHIDSYRWIKRIDGHRVTVINTPPSQKINDEKKLWFVNLGAYSALSMAEQHQFGLVVAKNPQQAKASARRRWLTGMTKIHKDDLHSISQSPTMDDLLPIHGNGQWSVELTQENVEIDHHQHPDWYGYWKI